MKQEEQMPPVVEKLIVSVTDMIWAIVRLINAKAEYQERYTERELPTGKKK